MALTRTQRFVGTSTNPFGTGAYTSTSFTPSNSSLLVAIAYAITTADGGMEGTDLTITDSAGLTWTSRAATTTSPAWSYGARIWTAPVGTGASMTVSVDCGAFSVEGYRLQVHEVTSDAGSVATGATVVGSDADGDGAASITLSAAPATSSIVIGACLTGLASGAGSVTEGSGWTEVNDASLDGWMACQSQQRTGSTSDQVAWADVCVGTPFGGSVLAAVEITETGSLEQEGFRWGVDDGNEAAHGWEAAQDANITLPDNQSRLLRALVNAAAGDPAAIAYTLRSQKNGAGGYVAVPVGASATTSPPTAPAATVTTIGAAADPWTINRSTAATGDMVVFVIAWDDSVDVTSVVAPAGVNSEAAVSIAGPIASASTEMRAQAWYYVATGAWGAGTLSFNPSASETCRAVSFTIPSGQFSASDPIGFAATRASAGTAESNVLSPTGTAEGDDGSGRLYIAFGSDVDALTAPGADWNTINNATGGGVGLLVGTRNTLVSNSESIAALTATITSDSWATLCFVVKPSVVNNEVYVTTSGNIAAGGEATTARLTAPSGKTTGDFVTGRRWDDENGTDTIDITADDYTEVEWLVALSSAPSDGDYFDFRVYAGAAALTTYTLTPRWTVGSSFDAALMAGIRQPFPLITRASLSAVSSGMIPPDSLPP